MMGCGDGPLTQVQAVIYLHFNNKNILIIPSVFQVEEEEGYQSGFRRKHNIWEKTWYITVYLYVNVDIFVMEKQLDIHNTVRVPEAVCNSYCSGCSHKHMDNMLHSETSEVPFQNVLRSPQRFLVELMRDQIRSTPTSSFSIWFPKTVCLLL